MSISNPETGGAPFDPALIARLANELFAALPGHSGPPPGGGVASAPPATPPVEVGALPVAPAIPPSSAVGPPTEVEFRSLPATVSGATLRPPQAGFTPSAVLGPYDFRPELIPDQGFMALPGGGVASAPPVTPPVEMGALSTAPAVTPASAVAPPTEAELRALPASLAGATAPPQAASTPSALASPGSSFYFLDAAQPPPPAAPALPLGDYGFHPDMLPDLGITAGPYDPRMDRRDFPFRS
jgi:cysteine desulfurase/selenocysteine lyase